MALLSAARSESLEALEGRFQQKISGLSSLESVAQCYTKELYREFQESIVMVRLFATIPYGQLPIQDKLFVDNLVKNKGVEQEIHDKTPILSLLGTSGKEPSWNSRENSQGHLGLPLSSVAFVDSIPMMSRLLRQLGLGLDWIDQGDVSIVKHTVGNLTGVFYVPAAAMEKDNQGRFIIPAQDFVSKFGIKTVFGFGGVYPESPTFYTAILFLREFLDETQVRKLSARISFFKRMTTGLVKRNIFVRIA